MARIQLTNLQCESKVTALEFHKTSGGYLSEINPMYDFDYVFDRIGSYDYWNYIKNPSTSTGATIHAVINSSLPQKQKWEMVFFLKDNPHATIQIAAPL